MRAVLKPLLAERWLTAIESRLLRVDSTCYKARLEEYEVDVTLRVLSHTYNMNVWEVARTIRRTKHKCSVLLSYCWRYANMRLYEVARAAIYPKTKPIPKENCTPM